MILSPERGSSSGRPPRERHPARILLADCEWTSQPVGHALADRLRENAEHVRWGPDARAEPVVVETFTQSMLHYAVWPRR